jgi:hypothetical protein
MKRVIAGAVLALAGCHKPMLLKGESYKQGYQYVHNLPAFDGHGRQQFSDAANGGWTAGGYCTLMAGWQNPKPSSIGDFVEGCAAAFAERGVK